MTRAHRDDDAETRTHVVGVARPRPISVVVRAHGARAEPATYRLRDGVCVIGSGSACDVVIADPTVSRMHAELHLVPEGVGLRDLGSRNGTFYLDQRVEKMILAPGAMIRVGAVSIGIEPDQAALGEVASSESDTYRGLVGRAPVMRRLFGILARLEGSLVTVLLEGESGVGKEVIARAIHDGSQASGAPFVAINCGAFARELVASELFGHKRGAFTGATEARDGAFALANGGTLFLDEIGELPLDLQPTLLRALETGEVRPLGSDKPAFVKVRVIAATNQDLGALVTAGRFREDLFYRLAVVRLRVPPLRERIEDVEPLAERFGAAAGLTTLPPHFVEKLKVRSYPGNARELRNVVQVFAALGMLPEDQPKTQVLEAALRELCDTRRGYAELKEELTDRFTRVYLAALLEQTGGNQSAAARLAGLDRTHMGRLVSRYGPFASIDVTPPRRNE